MGESDEYKTRHETTSLNEQVIFSCVNPMNYVFVETGSNIGAGIQKALDCGFSQVISIEINPRFAHECMVRFEREPIIKIWYGGSEFILPYVCRTTPFPCFFWLDAHSRKSSPLLDELQAILVRKNKQDVIAIDDIGILQNPRDWGACTKYGDVCDILEEMDTRRFDSTNGRQDILVATWRKHVG